MKYHVIRTVAPSLRTRSMDGEQIIKKDDKGLPKEVCNIDQFSGRRFMLNASGFICNDIMAFEQAQSDSVARSVLQRINVLHPQPTHDPDLSPDEIFERIVPANYSSPTDYVRISKKIAQLDYERLQAIKAKQEKQKSSGDKIEFGDSDKDLIDKQ